MFRPPPLHALHLPTLTHLHPVKVIVKLLDDPVHYLHLARLSAFATILHSQTLARAAHSTKSPVRVGQVYPFRICWRAASLKDAARLKFCWPFQSFHASLTEP